MHRSITHYNFLSDTIRRKIEESESEFLHQLLLVIENNYHDPQFSVTELARYLSTNRIYLYRKLKELLDLNASSLIRVYRLHKAKELMVNNSISLNVVATKSGFSNASYFTQCFKHYFGIIPSVYQKRNQEMISFEEILNKKIII